MRRHGVLILAVGALALTAACKPSAAPAKAQAAAKGAGRCAAYQAGRDHVIRTFCEGPAVMHITLNGAEHVLSGGTCETVGQTFSLNTGVVTDPSATITPDYAGLVTPGQGPFTGAVLAVRLGGRNYLLMQNHGEVTGHGGSFSANGHAVGGDRQAATVTATFTC